MTSSDMTHFPLLNLVSGVYHEGAGDWLEYHKPHKPITKTESRTVGAATDYNVCNFKRHDESSYQLQ